MKVDNIIGISSLVSLVAFFVMYKFYGMMHAISILMISNIVTTVIIRNKFGSIPKNHLISTIMIVVFGTMTLISKDSSFIQIKVTILNIIFALVLFADTISNKQLFKHLLGNSIQLSDMAYRILSLRFASLFCTIAILNEIVRRNYSEAVWVNFKVFGIAIITIIFMCIQLPFITKQIAKKQQQQ